MKPLKELPILCLPFRAMKEISKGMHSIIKMMSNRKNNKFPILRLPFLAIEEIFKTMHPIEIINFSMISKRTRTVAKSMSFYSKYSIDLSVANSTLHIGLYGTKESVSCTYVMTSDEKMNGKSEGKVEKWKQLCIRLLKTFNKQTIDILFMQMDADVDNSVSFIDFLKTNVKSVNECYLHQWDHQYNVDEDFAYLLNNITINSTLSFFLNIKNEKFDGKIPKNLNNLYIKNSEWIGYKRLLEIDCKSVILEKNRISDEQWNLFIKKWIAMETHLNLEYLHPRRQRFRKIQSTRIA
ncbi:hypothetical protein CRE_09946 [Caenorhabditis remanei]|uniref:F-box domain-containing protein n=1 Tax=Caenorhabditis remanei TaxID=31234 RepID=E3NV36_CAERE|nr:hypothetical protein CRE_09946 [Caenorhabditis remanei]